MATTKELLQGIEDRLNTIEQHLGIKPAVKRMSLWTKAGEHKVVAGLIVAVILGAFSLIAGAFHSQVNEYMDGRIHNQIMPITNQLISIDERTSRIEGEISILRIALAAQKYSAITPRDLKGHTDELKGLKNDLAQLKPNTPGFWPTSFQVITLLSKATSSAEPKHPLLDLTDISGSGKELFKYPPGSVLRLYKVIENITFKDAIVYLDSNVILRNVTFINCTLILPETQTLPKPLEEIGSQLLSASDLSKITLNAS